MDLLYFKCLNPVCLIRYAIEKGEEIICPECRSKMAKRIYPIMKPKRHWISKEIKADKMIYQVDSKWNLIDREMKEVDDPDFKDESKNVRKSLNKIKKDKKDKKKKK